MPTFETPEPIAVQLDLSAGNVLIKATDRTDTVVTVRPTNEATRSHVNAAAQIVVEYAAGRLTVAVPKSLRRYSFLGPSASVDVVIELPTGSAIQADTAWTTIHSEGRLGECRFDTGGAVRLDQTGPLRVETSHGEVSAERTVGYAHVTTGSGRIYLREVDGSTVLKNSSGGCSIGTANGEVRVNTANGDITVESAAAGVTAKTAYGSIRVGEAIRGALDLQTSYGGIDVGIRAGTAAWLDVNSRHGRVHNALHGTGGPDADDETVEIRASTSYGDITIRRS